MKSQGSSGFLAVFGRTRIRLSESSLFAAADLLADAAWRAVARGAATAKAGPGKT